ncbi:hypothetical protein O6H91_05G062800 [Diphasiastrum complanatum]|uniref:Uncharacterized protein n=1 Tax=Diphasiastrum complanatum TaxID=34168 RepID=A0ACC2DNT1_DIPCM|nr:hypothetical protein O6H91_05G062800 [Diphasiastrum complanatum]
MTVGYIRFNTEILYGFKWIIVLMVLSRTWPSCAQEADLPDPVMDPAEVEAIYRVLEGINYEIDWRSMFPGNPCTGGPHGLNCDIHDNTWHVVELNFGWVSDSVNNPPCSDNATIDPAILQFNHLRKLFFYQCFTKMLTEIPSDIWQLASSLQHLTFQMNSALVGEIPAELGNLTNLERLVLSQNSLQGSIPVEIGNLKKLQQLVLNGNELTGIIPDSFGNLDSLKVFDLSGNQLGGEIPSTLGRLNALQKLDLSENMFSGYISDELGNLESLQFLDLSSNKLNGSIPDSLRKLTSLQYLFLGDNSLGGSLPDFWGNFSNLIGLKLSDSSYEGRIPDSLALMHRLNSLALDNNRLVGTIPSSLGSLSRLYRMNLSSNLLTGPILFPASFMSRLGHNLNVRNNSGLCYGLPPVNVSSMELDQCSTQTSSNAYEESSQVHPLFTSAMDISHAASTRKAKALAVLFSVVFLCLSMQSQPVLQ